MSGLAWLNLFLYIVTYVVFFIVEHTKQLINAGSEPMLIVIFDRQNMHEYRSNCTVFISTENKWQRWQFF